MKKKLRIAILIDDYSQPAWSYKMLEEINSAAFGEIILTVKNIPDKKIKKSFVRRFLDNRNEIFFRLYSKLDRKFFKAKPDAFESKDIRNLITINSTNLIEVRPRKTKFSDRILSSDLEEIKKFKVDIFIRLGFRILRGDILKLSKFGIWSFHHGDNKVNRGGPPGYWEVLQNWSETGVILQILNENLDGGTVLFKSFSLTHHSSSNRNRNNYYWKALSFIPTKIEELYKLGKEDFFKKTEELNQYPQFYSNRLFTVPTNKEMLYCGSKLFLKKLRNNLMDKFYLNQWILLFNLNSSETFSTSFFRYKKILPPKDRFWADPHIIKRNDKYYIYIEELIYATNKGHIAVIEMDSKGNYKQPVKVLEKDYHLSYPFLYQENGDLYMIPETTENNTIELYKCIDFPLKWKLEKVLIDKIQAVDATVIKKNSKYWLFANVVKNTGASSLDELYVFSSSHLVSDKWISHPQNPVISDVKSSRPAGNFFKFKDKLFRPSQNGSRHYGYGMKINEVLELNETTYKEKVVDSIFPDWDKNIISTHTLNSVGNLTVIDAQFKRSRL